MITPLCNTVGATVVKRWPAPARTTTPCAPASSRPPPSCSPPRGPGGCRCAGSPRRATRRPPPSTALLGNKGELVRSVYLEGFRRLGDRLAAADEPDPLDRLAAQRDAYLANALENPHLYAVMFGPTPAGFEPDDEDTAFAVDLAPAHRLRAGLHRRRPARRRRRRHRPRAVGLSHGVCMLALAGMFDADEAHRHLVRLQDHLFVGLTAQRGALSGGA
ncbi:MAG: TetR-like C-terminal domain-containing protein [Acidimicrobiales bacterium]